MATTTSKPHVVHEALRYAAVGAICAAIDQSVALLLDYTPAPDLVSTAVGGAVGIGLSYVLCVRWVFTHRAVARRDHEAGLFALIALVALACKVGACAALLHFDLGFGAANAGAVAVAGTIAFVSKKLLLFRAPATARFG